MSLSTQPAPFNLAEQLLKGGMKLGGPAHELFLKFLHHQQHSLVGLYAFKPIPSLGVYDDMDRLMHDVWVLNAQGCEGVYVTLNPISKENPPLAWVESPNQLIVNPKKGLGPRDEHILRRRWIFIDLDRKVKTGNASKEEKALLYVRLVRPQNIIEIEEGFRDMATVPALDAELMDAIKDRIAEHGIEASLVYQLAVITRMLKGIDASLHDR